MSLPFDFLFLLHSYAVSQGPPDTPRVRGFNNLKSGSQSTLICTSNNGYPTPLVHWYLGSKNVTQNSSVQTEMTDEQRVFTLSNLTFVPTRYNHGQLLVCEILHSAPPNSWTKNKTVVLNIACKSIFFSSGGGEWQRGTFTFITMQVNYITKTEYFVISCYDI